MKAFVVVARDPRGKQHWRTVGAPPMKIDDAREIARKTIRSIREAPPNSFEGVAREWFKRHVVKNKLRSAGELERFMNQHLFDAWPGRDLSSIKRVDVVRILDKIEDNHGARQADEALSTLRRIFNWQEARDQNFSSPLARGMRRQKTKERERKRVLTDDEIRTLWDATEGGTSYARIIRFALLTGQRREKFATMDWADLDGNVWNIRTEEREKGNAGELVLPETALEVLGERGEGLVFPGRDGKKISGWSKHKAMLDKRAKVDGWVFHDLRRTARSLMSRAGVRPDVAEKVLGHTLQGVERVYDRHAYVEEKGEAVAKLAGLLGLILNPPQANVVHLKTS